MQPALSSNYADFPPNQSGKFDLQGVLGQPGSGSQVREGSELPSNWHHFPHVGPTLPLHPHPALESGIASHTCQPGRGSRNDSR